ncbi:MAG: HAMP domain-containing histidine kinase [Saprospiraceae bacterium]|nr:HAMP domain-containing histidine kinase [Saprospiraceae bacterium]
MKYLSYGVMVYMLLALVWWTVLLSKNNELLFNKNLEIHKIQIQNIAGLSDQEKVTYNSLKDEYRTKKHMIFGEGLVFGISLIIGMWLIQKAYNKEIGNNKKQKNFLLSITHELKTPITSIGLISETLIRRKLNPDAQALMLESISIENKRLESLVSNLLMATQLDNNYVFNFEKVSPLELLEKINKTISITFPDVRIELKHKENTQEIECDVESIISVFSNIIQNSIKYSDSPAIIQIDIKNFKTQVEIIFSDQGSGIPENEKTKVLQQFYRIGNEDTRKTNGTGLGLYIVKKIVEGHKGSIVIKDNVPKGTSISIILPINQNL